MNDNTVIIECNRCTLRGRVCGDCMLSAVVDAPPVVELDFEELAAVELLADAGLVPPPRTISRGRRPHVRLPERRAG
ncbi:hypothetical protein [Amycolatopsis methanolica]|uniref:Uncharacterized protein n=1 Tax=Amycolatopsis methanolica 239 TaxID=1068978 RepID=A0A076N335_AMYME|nr:hypothetical protein [Amycolatopsis methanolica]AIJ25210.1 hypothetical protein AMETH_5118 [Amycolatopsis methanolica 239]